MHFITQYYDIDWLAITLGLIGLWMVGSKHKYGFYFLALSSTAWLIFGIIVQSLAQILANIVFIIINIRGYRNWKKNA